MLLKNTNLLLFLYFLQISIQHTYDVVAGPVADDNTMELEHLTLEPRREVS